MKDELIKKLRKVLEQPIKEEYQVVYIMAKIRKLLEHLKGDLKVQKYPLLNFYCNWTLHPRIDNTSPIKKILEKTEKDFDKQIEFISLEHFRNDLIVFLKRFNLPAEIVKNNEKWESFKWLLLDILVDSPLINPTNSIEQFLFEKFFTKDGLKSINWKIKYKDGSKMDGTFGKI